MSEETGGAAAAATEAPPEKKKKKNAKKEYERVLPKPEGQMALTTRLYELMLLLDPAEASRTWDKLAEWVKEMIEGKHGGTIQRLDKWAESKKLAYEIKGLKRVTYMLVWFRAKPEITDELERALRLDERCARHLLLVHEEEPPGVGKSAEEMEQANPPRESRGYGDRGGYGDRDRGDRGDRGGRY